MSKRKRENKKKPPAKKVTGEIQKKTAHKNADENEIAEKKQTNQRETGLPKVEIDLTNSDEETGETSTSSTQTKLDDNRMGIKSLLNPETGSIDTPCLTTEKKIDELKTIWSNIKQLSKEIITISSELFPKNNHHEEPGKFEQLQRKTIELVAMQQKLEWLCQDLGFNDFSQNSETGEKFFVETIGDVDQTGT